MRGSPLLRTLILLFGLFLSGLGMWRVAGAVRKEGEVGSVKREEEVRPVDCGYELTFSAAVKRVELRTAAGRVLLDAGPQQGGMLGVLALDVERETVLLHVEWADGGLDFTRFAKLVLEPSGKRTMTRYFEAKGELNDAWELSDA